LKVIHPVHAESPSLKNKNHLNGFPEHRSGNGFNWNFVQLSIIEDLGSHTHLEIP